MTATNIVSKSINCIEYVLIKHLISEVIWTHIYILHWGHELAFPTVIIQILTKYFRKLTTGDNSEDRKDILIIDREQVHYKIRTSHAYENVGIQDPVSSFAAMGI